jgi:hypothetical protein
MRAGDKGEEGEQGQDQDDYVVVRFLFRAGANANTQMVAVSCYTSTVHFNQLLTLSCLKLKRLKSPQTHSSILLCDY